MSDWVVLSKTEEWFKVNVGDCSKEHALSVVETLVKDAHTPNDLVLKKIGSKFRGLFK